MSKKAIAAGHICLDITPVFSGDRAETGRIEDILKPGRLLHVGKADVHTGGSVANTGLAMKILGADVTLMGKIGSDAFGNVVLRMLKQYGADGSMLISDSLSTSYSVVLAIPGIDRIFLHSPGANDSFYADDLPQHALEEAALLHFGYPPLMRSMSENGGSELLKIMRRAKACGCATSLDMAAVDPASPAGRADWKAILEKVLPFVDFFLPSAEELCFMLDRDRYDAWQRRAAGRDVTELLEIEQDIAPLADTCMSFGAKVLVIKCGRPGMYWRTADDDVLRKCGARAELDTARWAGRQGFERSFVPDAILSGTGAGDTSIAAFLTAMLDGCPPEECMQLAAATGASCLTAYDALSGLRSFDELRAKIANGWKKVEGRRE